MTAGGPNDGDAFAPRRLPPYSVERLRAQGIATGGTPRELAPAPDPQAPNVHAPVEEQPVLPASTINNVSPGLGARCPVEGCGEDVPGDQLVEHGKRHRLTALTGEGARDVGGGRQSWAAEVAARSTAGNVIRVEATVHAERFASNRSDALAVPCPLCIAGPGQACIIEGRPA